MHGRAREAAVEIVRTLRAAGHEAYFAGGCVRDELLGHTPHDYDVATDAPPERVASLFARTREVGKAFAVVQVRLDGVSTEVATFRAEGAYSDRRRPDSIRLTDAREDALRRDFTINALFLDPLDADDAGGRGRVVDFVGGVADLRARVLRAVGDADARLAEDHLRALRAVRFAARLGFEIEPATASAVRSHARELGGVSRERVGDECRKMLAHATRRVAVALLHELGLDGPVLGVEPLASIETVAVAALPERADAAGGLAAWLIDRSSGDPDGAAGLVRSAAASLCLSNEETADVRAIVRIAGVLRDAWDGLGVAGRKRLAAAPRFADTVAIVSAREPRLAARIDEVVATLSTDGVGIAPPRLITGDELIARGLTPGPKFGVWLDEVYDAQLEGRVRTAGEAIELVESWAAAKGRLRDPRDATAGPDDG